MSRGGTFDITNLPAALTSASYDANNRLTKWGRQAVSYDTDGNLVSNGKNTYTWNTRNQLTGISGGTSASFLYDALGRRESKTISSTSTNFLYDGLNLEQELNGTTPTVNYLTGAGIDETLSRMDSSGTYSYLTDNLGSTLALTSSAGAISTSYSYEPYGNTTASGSSSTNALQYTGRENDGTGLYYYRARYYSPTYGRFISEDPLGLLGGINEYGYASGNPMNLDDPLGLADWRQFQMGGLDQQGMQALGAEQSVAAEVAANQYFAKQISFLGSQCFAIEFAAEFKANATTAQKIFGPWETAQDIRDLAHEAGLAGTAYLGEQGLDKAAVYAAGRGSTAGVRKLMLAKLGLKIADSAPLAIGTGFDIGDMLNSAFDVMYYDSGSCCTHN